MVAYAFVTLLALGSIAGALMGVWRAAIVVASAAIAGLAAVLTGPVPGLLAGLLILVVGFGVHRILRRRRLLGAPGVPSRIGGSVLGIAFGAAFAVAAVVFAGLTSPDLARILSAAYGYAPARDVAERTMTVLPDDMSDTSFDLPPPRAAEQAEDPASDAPPRPIGWAEVAGSNGARERRFAGTVSSSLVAPMAFEIAGQVSDVPVDEGARVARGDVLARLDETPLRLDVEARRANLLEVEAVLEEARVDFLRQRTLFERDVVAEAALDAATATFETAQSRVDAARSALARAEDTAASGVLRAPFDGLVAAKYADPPLVVAAGEPVVDLEGLDAPLEISIDVPEDVRDRLEIGQDHAVIDPRASDGEIPARISEIGVRAAGRSTYPVNLLLDEAVASETPGLRSGVTRQVRLALASS